MPRWNGTFESRFWDKVHKTDACWFWLGAKMKNGYGTYGRHMAAIHSQLAHRWAWEFKNGPVPEGMMVLHHCDVRHCVNPSHLFLGTNSDNQLDRVSKGRHHNAVKTACKYGHPYNEQSTYVKHYAGSQRQSRVCRKCYGMYKARKRMKKRMLQLP